MTPTPAKPPHRETTVSDRLRPREEELREAVERHRAWVESGGREGTRADLSELDLSGFDLTGANLSSAKLVGCLLNAAKLNGADLSGAYLAGSSLARAELNLANLTAARLTEAYLGGAELCRAELGGAYLERANLSRANLDHAGLAGADLTRADFTEANLTRADLTRANLTRATLANADLRRAILSAAELDRADLTGANLFAADLAAARLHRATLGRADLRQANLTGAHLTGADLSRADLKGARLADADLRSARVHWLDQSYVRGAQFSALAPRWQAFLAEVFFGPLAGWFSRRGWHRVADLFAVDTDHNDAWSILRQSYAGPRLLFLFFTVILFALPYVGKAAVFSAVGPVERHMVEQARSRKGQIEAKLEGQPANQELIDELERVNEFIDRMERKPVWKVLLAWDRGHVWPSVRVGLLVLYNFGVFALINRVSALRDEEERSGWTPARRYYRHLLWVHRAVVFLFYFSLGSFFINVADMLGEEVLIPKLPHAAGPR